MRSLEEIRRANDDAVLREAFEANHERGRRLQVTDLPEGEVELASEKARRYEVWLRHKAANKRRFWALRTGGW
jgi:hypothetical protein